MPTRDKSTALAIQEACTGRAGLWAGRICMKSQSDPILRHYCSAQNTRMVLISEYHQKKMAMEAASRAILDSYASTTLAACARGGRSHCSPAHARCLAPPAYCLYDGNGTNSISSSLIPSALAMAASESSLIATTS